MNKKLFILFLIINTLFSFLEANVDFKKKSIKNEIIVGFYGRPNAKSLGILGESNIEILVNKMKKKQNYYEDQLNDKIDVKMAFHIIHSLATKDPGRRKDYLLHLNEKTVMKYIKKAQEENFLVILDVQLGTKSVKAAIKPLLKYLKYDNVHLAIDPEFKIPSNGKYPPGKYVGHILAKDLNRAQDLIRKYLEENNIKNKKKLIVHMFLDRMLRQKNEVKKHDNIKLIYNIDGFGRSVTKVKIYNNLYAQRQAHKALGGFKIFYKNDQKPLLSPQHILGWKNVGNEKIEVSPFYINYH